MVASERTFAMIKPHCFDNRDEIINLIQQFGNFKITHELTVQFTPALVDEFYSEHIGKAFYKNLSECMCDGNTLCLILEGDNVIHRWRSFIGPTNVIVACETSPTSLRALFGDKTNTAKNAVHGSDSKENAEREINIFF